MQVSAVVVPTLNEGEHIASCVRALLEQMPRDGRLYVADGGSADATVPIVKAMADHDDRIILVDNPRRTQAAAVNLVARLLQTGRATHDNSGVLVRVDAHSGYPPDFLANLLRAYQQQRPASVVVPSHTVAQSCFQKGVAAALNSRLGNGGAAHRAPRPQSGPIDHGHHALFDLDFFQRVGGYDERFRANEDAELDLRIASAGGRIWMCAEATRYYYPRRTPLALAKQFYFYGLGRGQSAKKHKAPLRARQLLPVLATLGNLGAIAAATIEPAFALAPALYLATCLAWGTVLAIKARDLCVVTSGVAAVIMHMSWGLGFLAAWLGAKAVVPWPAKDAHPAQ